MTALREGIFARIGDGKEQPVVAVNEDIGANNTKNLIFVFRGSNGYPAYTRAEEITITKVSDKPHKIFIQPLSDAATAKAMAERDMSKHEPCEVLGILENSPFERAQWIFKNPSGRIDYADIRASLILEVNPNGKRK